MPRGRSRAIDDKREHDTEREVVRELGNQREGPDRWEPTSDHSHVHHADRKSGSRTPTHGVALRKRARQDLAAHDRDPDVDDRTPREARPARRNQRADGARRVAHIHHD